MFDNCSLHTAIFLILQYAYLARLITYITPDNFPAGNKDRLHFPQTVFLSS